MIAPCCTGDARTKKSLKASHKSILLRSTDALPLQDSGNEITLPVETYDFHRALGRDVFSRKSYRLLHAKIAFQCSRGIDSNEIESESLFMD